MVLVQNWDFFHLFIFGKIGKKKVLSDILERKKLFSRLKKKREKKEKKKTKNWPFPHGLVHGFGPQVGFVPRSHFWQNRQQKVFGDILETKRPL